MEVQKIKQEVDESNYNCSVQHQSVQHTPLRENIVCKVKDEVGSICTVYMQEEDNTEKDTESCTNSPNIPQQALEQQNEKSSIVYNNVESSEANMSPETVDVDSKEEQIVQADDIKLMQDQHKEVPQVPNYQPNLNTVTNYPGLYIPIVPSFSIHPMSNSLLLPPVTYPQQMDTHLIGNQLQNSEQSQNSSMIFSTTAAQEMHTNVIGNQLQNTQQLENSVLLTPNTGSQRKHKNAKVNQSKNSQQSKTFAVVSNAVRKIVQGQESSDAEKHLQCKICGKLYKLSYPFINHMFKVHNIDVSANFEKTNEKFSLFCDTCNKGFKYKSDLERHHDTHMDDRLYECEICNITYKSKSNLTDHMKIKHCDTAKYTCAVCSLTFPSKWKYEMHLVSHSDAKNFVCNQCGKEYKYFHTLADHLKKHVNENSNLCQFCGQGFKSRGQLKHHMKEKFGDEIHTKVIECHDCQVCGKNFLTGKNLRRHMISHTDERNYECTVCGQKFKQGAHLKGHMGIHEREEEKKRKTEIIVPKIITCEKCRSEFKTQQEFIDHLKETAYDLVHSKPKDNTCKFCVNSPRSNYEWYTHQLTHTDGRPYFCGICDSEFRIVEKYRDHMCFHLKFDITEQADLSTFGNDNEIKYVCKECPTQFLTRQSLQCHILDSGGDNVHSVPEFTTVCFPCTICKAIFESKDDLVGHKSIHEKMSIFPCKECYQEFDYYYKLKNHISLHHKIQSTETFNCQLCKFECNSKRELKVHFVESSGDGLHTRNNSFVYSNEAVECGICLRQFRSKSSLKVHITVKHKKPSRKSKADNIECPSEASSMDGSLPSASSSLNSTDIVMKETNLDSLSEETSNSATSSALTQDKERNPGDSSLPEPLQTIYADNCAKSFSCQICKKKYKTKNTVNTHMKTHNKNFKCDLCDKKFYYDKQLQHHIDNQYQCKLCPERFCKVSHFRKHHNGHRNNKDLQCPLCLKKFLYELNLKRHISLHSKFDTGPFECKICKATFKRKDTYSYHVRDHEHGKQFLCHACGKQFSVLQNLVSHAATHDRVHGIKKKSFKCEKCEKTYANRNGLNVHTLYKHTDKKLKCRYCSKIMAIPNTLKRHELRHTGVKKFECEYCVKKFYTKDLLKTHIVVHTKERPFKCQICDKRFSQFSALSRHKKTMH
ncbi:zinc finger protein 184-like [Mytilus californianus]|uniref:zinc finger protein 184-like n=1 Tax=Mytilus californianus TaxID=6549 RepID=UPI0022456590|nr:zinc finger protein 184-like [Mytilus californianus]